MNQQISGMNKILIPIGFIFIQLPNRNSPQEIWPSMTWTDISTQYSNVFFRVLGDKTASFGNVQEENVNKITNIISRYGSYGNVPSWGPSYMDVTCPESGWSEWIWFGNSEGGRSIFNQFYYSGGEVRPRNMAIKVWKRTQ